MSQGPVYPKVSVTNAITGVVSVSGTVGISGNLTNIATVTTVQSCSVNNALSAVVSVSGTVTTRDQGVATANSAVPLFVTYMGGNDGTNIRAFKVDTAGVAAVTASVNNAVSAVVSVSGTVVTTQSAGWTMSVNNALSGVVSVSGTIQTKADATSTSAIPLFANMVGGSDGTNLYAQIAISTGIVASANTQTRGVIAASPLVQWVRFASAAANAKCVASRTAITGAYNVIMGFSYGIACGTASSTIDSVSVTHGAAGTVSVFTIGPARCPASDSRYYSQENLGWTASLFTAVNVEFQASAPASGFQYATIWGYTLPS